MSGPAPHASPSTPTSPGLRPDASSAWAASMSRCGCHPVRPINCQSWRHGAILPPELDFTWRLRWGRSREDPRGWIPSALVRSHPSRPLDARGGRSLCPTARVALHQIDDRCAGGDPFGLVTEDDAIWTPPAELRHRRDDRVVGQCPVAAGLDLARDQIAPNGLEWRSPAADPDPISLAERLEQVVVADGVGFVLGLVADQVHPPAASGDARQPAILVDDSVADRAGREGCIGPRWRSVRETATPTEGSPIVASGRAALEAGGFDHTQRHRSRSSSEQGGGLDRASPDGPAQPIPLSA